MALLFVLHPISITSINANLQQVIPCTGVESAPADILAWALVKRVREDLSSSTRKVDSTIKEMKYAISCPQRNTSLTHSQQILRAQRWYHEYYSNHLRRVFSV